MRPVSGTAAACSYARWARRRQAAFRSLASSSASSCVARCSRAAASTARRFCWARRFFSAYPRLFLSPASVIASRGRKCSKAREEVPQKLNHNAGSSGNFFSNTMMFLNVNLNLQLLKQPPKKRSFSLLGERLPLRAQTVFGLSFTLASKGGVYSNGPPTGGPNGGLAAAPHAGN